MKPEYSPEGASINPPWWKFGLVWMVWAGPAVVVVASFITLGLAIMMPDPVLVQAPTTIGQTAAQMARNHAATGNQAEPAKGPAR
jgi:uncharacterized protein